MKYKVNFTAWYLNPSRTIQLLHPGDPNLFAQAFSVLNNFVGIPKTLSAEDFALAQISDFLEEWLHANKVPNINELILTGERIEKGQLFTIYQDFYGKGLSKYANPDKSIPRNAIAELHATIRGLDEEKPNKIRILYSPLNLCSNSAWHRLSGKTRLFCFCYIDDVIENEILARPFMIGDPHSAFECTVPEMWLAYNYGEIQPSEIDQFSKIKEEMGNMLTITDLKELKEIPELEIKNAFADIFHEVDIQKDWGGEKSDLFTTNISVKGKALATAFLFKGPAKFSPMKMTHLGKNGDQIDRLFSEPADLLILQHCHTVTTPVRNNMRAYSSRVYNLKHFSIIDGYNTLRILKAYKKCGF